MARRRKVKPVVNKLNRTQEKKVLRSSLRSGGDRENNNNESEKCDIKTKSVENQGLSANLSGNPNAKPDFDTSKSFESSKDEPPKDEATKDEPSKDESKEFRYNIVVIIEEDIALALTPENRTTEYLAKMVEVWQKQWTFKEFFEGLLYYIIEPKRDLELFNKVERPPVPPMTGEEEVLLYMVTRLNWDNNIDMVEALLEEIKSNVMKADETDMDFLPFESMSHFYAVLCIFTHNHVKFRCFVLDALYCLQYRAVKVVKQCLDLWMHMVPQAHEEKAKNPAYVCLVYMLHFFEYNNNAVKDIRNTIKQRFNYHINRKSGLKRVLKLLENAVLEMDDKTNFLDLAFAVLAKRQGPQWCQNNLMTNILIPIMWKNNIEPQVKAFCIDILGTLFVPYCEDMQSISEGVMDNLTYMLLQFPTAVEEEAINQSLARMRFYDMERYLYSTVFRRRHLFCSKKRPSCMA